MSLHERDTIFVHTAPKGRGSHGSNGVSSPQTRSPVRGAQGNTSPPPPPPHSTPAIGAYAGAREAPLRRTRRVPSINTAKVTKPPPAKLTTTSCRPKPRAL